MTRKLRCCRWIVLLVLCSGVPLRLVWGCQEPADTPEILPGTALLREAEPLDRRMVSGLQKFCLRELSQAPQRRSELWEPFVASRETLTARVQSRRLELLRLIGAVDQRVSADRGGESAFEFLGRWPWEIQVSSGEAIEVRRVRWPVLSSVSAEGLMMIPDRIRAAVVLLPDADWTPEMLCGVQAGAELTAGLVERLLGAGCLVVIPTLISRDCHHSGNPAIAMTNQSHREYLYRQAFVAGRHVIGYEVQKILAAVDLLERVLRSEQQGAAGESVCLGVGGVGEGGLLALTAAAVDSRLTACWVAGRFQEREGLWREPVYRNVWRLLTEFGDAEQAGMIAPRSLTIEACRVPVSAGAAVAGAGRSVVAAPGRIEQCRLSSVQAEVTRARRFFQVYDAEPQLQLIVSGPDGAGLPASSQALASFLSGLLRGTDLSTVSLPWKLAELREIEVDAGECAERQRRQLDELQEHVQRVIRRSHQTRDGIWQSVPADDWSARQDRLRALVHDELIGRLPHALLSPDVRSRKVRETHEYLAYEVELRVFEDVLAGGILLLPKGIPAGQRRAAVVCQHGLEGVPLDTISRDSRPFASYKAFSEQLVQQGYVVFAPQNPYRGGDEFRVLQRMSNPLGRTLFSLIVEQHRQLLNWLQTLPQVKADQIAFYGLSYGGKTAMRVPPLLQQYRVAICSGDFTDWPRTISANDERFSYVFTGEYEIPEWNLAHLANYAELARLMSPRPFMVEAGYRDGGQPAELVAAEFAKVRRHYDRLGISERAELEFFDGPHTIHGVGTFRFLRRHLQSE